MSDELPIFPLSTVLFPGGSLPLRIFERRYLDMVRDCARRGSGFGVCLILEGRETGQPARPASVGTIAHINDFYTLPDGLLGLGTIGQTRFRALRSSVRDNGLIVAEVEHWPDEPSVPVPAEHLLLVTILERMVEQLGIEFPGSNRTDYDDATWVGFRLAELLPIALHERQYLLELTDPLRRLDELTTYLPRFQKP